MTSSCKPLFFVLVAFCAILTVAIAAAPTTGSGSRGNYYCFYTKALQVDDSGVVAVPSRFKWSVETSFAGVDPQGNSLPDSRVMLRLYDPHRNFTALTAQMDLATAARLHRELGEIIVKKLENPNFDHRPQLYDPKLIPTGRFRGIDENGTAIIELEDPQPEKAE
jgi:hypothetical protein